MRAVVQRVEYAKLKVDSELVSDISKGLLVLLGVGNEDNSIDVDYLVDKVLGLRIFEDEQGKMNLSVKDIEGEVLVVSQFTLYGDVRKGKRPSFSDSADPDKALKLYEEFVTKAKKSGLKIKEGVFGADMDVEFLNQGPVTILLDSSKTF